MYRNPLVCELHLCETVSVGAGAVLLITVKYIFFHPNLGHQYLELLLR